MADTQRCSSPVCECVREREPKTDDLLRAVKALTAHTFSLAEDDEEEDSFWQKLCASESVRFVDGGLEACA